VEDWGYRFPKENGESVRQSYYGELHKKDDPIAMLV